MSTTTFDDYALELSLRHTARTLLLAAIVVVAFLPTDTLVAGAANHPDFARGMLINRVVALLLTLVGYAAIRREIVRRRLGLMLALGFAIASVVIASTSHLLISSSSPAAVPWYYGAYLIPFITVTLVVPMRERIAQTLLVTGAAVLPYRLLGSGLGIGSDEAVFVVMLAFACVVSVMMGEAGRRLLATQHRQRIALAAKTDRIAALEPLRAELLERVAEHLDPPATDLVAIYEKADDAACTKEQLEELAARGLHRAKRARRLVGDLQELARLRTSRATHAVDLTQLTKDVVEGLAGGDRVQLELPTSMWAAVEKKPFANVLTTVVGAALREEPQTVTLALDETAGVLAWRLTAKRAFAAKTQEKLRLARALLAVQGGSLVVTPGRAVVELARIEAAPESRGPTKAVDVVVVGPDVAAATRVAATIPASLRSVPCARNNLDEVLDTHEPFVVVTHATQVDEDVLTRVVSAADERAMAELDAHVALAKLMRRREAMSSRLSDTADQLEHHLARTQGDVDGLLNELDTSRSAERQRIARELHDDLGQLLSGARIELAMAQGQTADAGALNAVLTSIDGLLARAEHAVRRTAQDDPPTIVERDGLAKALTSFVADFTRRARVPCRVRTPGGDQPKVKLEAAVAGEVFRILQEALTNVAKHADARNVEVTLEHTSSQVVLRVSDDGRGGAPTESEDRHGLAGMRERAAAIGGEVTVSSTTDRGTTVTLVLPHRSAK